MKAWAAAYGAALLAMAVLDGLWLGVLAKAFYQRELGPLMADPVRLLPAAVFYFGYPAGLVALALAPQPGTLGLALLRSALVGLLAYGTYDMTNLATLKGFGGQLALVDMAWGMVASALAGGVAWMAWQRLQ